jgi:DNA modification methylase
MNTHKIILGDCIAGMGTLPAECVQTCITSPPYWGLRNYQGGTEEIGAEKTPEAYVENMVKVFREVRRILRDDGTVWLNLGDSYWSNTFSRKDPANKRAGLSSNTMGLKPKDLVGIPWCVAFALRADGWYLRQDIIWHKPNPMPEAAKDRCTRAHEYIFMFSKKPKYYHDHIAIKEKGVGAPHSPVGDKSQYDRLQRTHRILRWESNGMRNKRSVWTVCVQTTKPFRGAHFATFPKDLIESCVLAGCPVGGTVFDPFTGSGTTAIVAMNHGRNFIGTELNPEYIKIAEARIANEVPTTLQEFIQ